jgi:hypothetical protein
VILWDEELIAITETRCMSWKYRNRRRKRHWVELEGTRREL